MQIRAKVTAALCLPFKPAKDSRIWNERYSLNPVLSFSAANELYDLCISLVLQYSAS